MMKKVIYIVLALTVVSCGGPAPESQTGAKQAVEYPTVLIDTASAEIYTDFAAELQSAQVVEIRPRVSGYIDNIAVQEGAHVHRGQMLFQINQDDLQEQLNTANAQVDASKAQVDKAHLEVEKLTPLVDKGIISPFELQNAQSNLTAAKAQLNASKSQARNAQISLSYASITSPVDGVVGRIVVRSGTLVSPSTPDALTAVSSDGPISAYFSLDENSILAMTQNTKNTGISLRQMVDMLPEATLVLSNGEIYPQRGKLELASGILDMTTGSMQLKAIFPNPDGILRTGASAKVRINAPFQGVIIVPQSATFELQGKKMVYCVDSTGAVASQAITVFGTSGNDYVLHSGLQRGDRIVTEGFDFITEGEVIAIK